MKTMKTLALAVVALAAFTSCADKNEQKFNEKEYAERKTANLNEIVTLSEEQQKEVYSIFEAQGLEIKENIKNMKCGERRAECPRPERKADCPRPERRAECPKAECKPAECPKAECKPAECPKAECKPAECPKAECKADCPKPERKADCPKPKCKADCPKKENCEKRANCEFREECDKVGRRPHRHHHHMVAPEKMKETMEKIMVVLTPEQQELFKNHRATRRECAASMKECCPTPNAAK